MADLATTDPAHGGPKFGAQFIKDALSMMRNHLGMDVAALKEFDGSSVTVQVVDAPEQSDDFRQGMTWSDRDTCCKLVLTGNLPQRVPDTDLNPIAREVPIVKTLGIRAFLALPLMRADGTPYGMLSFTSRAPDPHLADRDLSAIEMFATLVEREVQRRIESSAAVDANRDTIQNMIEKRKFAMFAQPIRSLGTERVDGYEALCRFESFPGQPADAVFDFAASVGLRAQLETEVILAALDAAKDLGEDTYISVNASPTTVFSKSFNDLFQDRDISRIVLEMTEHQEVRDYRGLLSLLAPLRAKGLRIAVDDAGTGYSGLHQIVQLQPDMIKLDRALVSGIDSDQAKRAMCAAMVHYAGESGACVVAEGVETADETAELVRLGVTHAQGFHLGRPLPFKERTAA